MTTTSLRRNRLLSAFDFSATHGEGWYVRVKETSGRDGRLTHIAGPFASQRDAIAFRILFVDSGLLSSAGVWFYTSQNIRYLIATDGGESRRERTKLVSPASVRVNRAAWDGRVDDVTLRVCFETAEDIIRHGR